MRDPLEDFRVPEETARARFFPPRLPCFKEEISSRFLPHLGNTRVGKSTF